MVLVYMLLSTFHEKESKTMDQIICFNNQLIHLLSQKTFKHFRKDSFTKMSSMNNFCHFQQVIKTQFDAKQMSEDKMFIGDISFQNILD